MTAQKRHLEVSLEAVRVARDQAERASSLKTSLLRLVSHELRAPFALIRLQVGLFELDPALALDAAQQQLVHRISQAARRLEATVDAMLLQARIETGRVGNALKFTERGSVEIGVEQDGSALRIAVRDTGRGIRPEDHARIFEPFQQLEGAREVQLPGLGLGLALVRDVVAALGGRIDVDSAPGRGSIFTVTLPKDAPAETRT